MSTPTTPSEGLLTADQLHGLRHDEDAMTLAVASTMALQLRGLLPPGMVCTPETLAALDTETFQALGRVLRRISAMDAEEPQP